MALCLPGFFKQPFRGYGAFQASFNNPFRWLLALQTSSNNPFEGMGPSRHLSTAPSDLPMALALEGSLERKPWARNNAKCYQN